MYHKAQKLTAELIRLRRDIHQHPELGFQEFRTAALVADTLSEIGLDPQTEIGRTGVVVEIGNGNGPTIAIRADMDALPIHEKTNQPYGSQTDGVMHACGHDAHTAILLGTAHLLYDSFRQEQWQGKVRLLFQPSEECFDYQGISGATAMIDDGALENIDAAIALHVASDKPMGILRFHDEYSLAAVDSFEAWIRGDGGHGAAPHEGADPLHMLSFILPAIYAIPSRLINPLRPCVVSLGQVHAGKTDNVIPNEVYLQGTIRSYDEETRTALHQAIHQALSISQAMRGTYKIEITKGYPALYNSPLVNSWLKQTTADILGEEKVLETEFGMGAEDFAYMAQKAPGAMFMLGAAIPDGVARHHHTDIFDIDESVLPMGTAVLAETARRFVTGQYRL